MKNEKAETATISISTNLAERARKLSKNEGRTLSELFREAFRFYEFHQTGGREVIKKSALQNWSATRRSLHVRGKREILRSSLYVIALLTRIYPWNNDIRSMRPLS